MIREQFKKIIQVVFSQVRKHYGANLTSFVIFGSCGRGTPHQESDIDMLIILKKVTGGRITRMKEFRDSIDLGLEPIIKELQFYHIYTTLSPIIRSEKEVLQGSPLFIEMTTGIKVYKDRNSFFENYLNDLRQKMSYFGSEKKENGYWVYKKNVGK
ncbi:MAG: nucleotidyltransferase domain-containing protein, partial [Candidatus Atribacteria bacterium]|nr:nucleotidyltransferase domain-containing protein [Candidatus Atribacteria bacterium]